MKKEKSIKKLELNKVTIAHLKEDEMNQVIGGYTTRVCGIKAITDNIAVWMTIMLGC
jgi:natural product precursor